MGETVVMTAEMARRLARAGSNEDWRDELLEPLWSLATGAAQCFDTRTHVAVSKEEWEAAKRLRMLESMAATGTVDSIMSTPDLVRGFIAIGIDESSRRKKAEQVLQRLGESLKWLSQFTDGIVCYASTILEYESNAVAKEVRDAVAVYEAYAAQQNLQEAGK